MLRVVAYMAIIVVASTGVEVLEAILFALPRVVLGKAATFLRFGWSGDALDTWVRERWCGLYDEVYVEEQFLGPLADHRYGIAELCDKIDQKLAHKTTPLRAANPTVPKPFNLTQPKVKMLEPVVKTRAKINVLVPKSTYVKDPPPGAPLFFSSPCACVGMPTCLCICLCFLNLFGLDRRIAPSHLTP